MVTVSSAFISSRRERIIVSVLSASGCAFKAASVDVLRAVFAAGFALVLETLGKTDVDNTDVARDQFLSLYREPEYSVADGRSPQSAPRRRCAANPSSGGTAQDCRRP